MVDVQEHLDNWLESNPGAQKYVTKLWYIPMGTPVPSDVTHVARLASAKSAERSLTVGLVVKPQYAAALDMLLAMVATQPN
jgi:hypothetical protein